MAEHRITLNIQSINQNHKQQDLRTRSHRITDVYIPKLNSHRCKSLEKYHFEHNHFTHSKIVRASHDIPHQSVNEHEHKHLHEDHSRTVLIKKRAVPENFLLDSFPS